MAGLSDSPDSAATLWIAISSLIVAAFGVIHAFTSSLLADKRSKEQLSIARMQLRAGILSASRKAWIETFRDRLADTLSPQAYYAPKSCK